MRFHVSLKLIATLAVVSAFVIDVSSAQQPFSTLQTGFTQSVYSTATPRAGYLFTGIAFAPNGDLWVSDCPFSGGPLYRFQAASTVTVHATTVHPLVAGSPFASNVGCGLTNHPDGTIYANTSAGIVNVNASTGAPIGLPFGPAGNALGIAVDPQTNNLIYPAYSGCVYGSGAGCSLISVNPATKVATTLTTLTPGESSWIDGVFFDNTGNYIFLSTRLPVHAVTILSRTGAFIQQVTLPSEPDGIAFHLNPTFVVTNNTDGTITRLDFPANNFNSVPTITPFASGGFRGDLAQVGADSCLYLSQEGTHYADATSSSDNSVVRICPGFAPPPGVKGVQGSFLGDGAAIKAADGSLVEYDAKLNCDTTKAPNQFGISWKGDNEFKLSAALTATCLDDHSLDSGLAAPAGFNTISGTGAGSYNGNPGASIQYTLTDSYVAGKPETATITITYNGATVLSASGPLVDGQNEAYKP